MSVEWLNAATRSLRQVHARIAADNPEAARKVVKRIQQAVERLADFPESGRLGQVAGTRELVVPGLPYLVVYRVGKESVEILRVFHTSQDRPGGSH
ncbi:MAG TPA: type II toxin-antitoxin system RelE/ParE family toxin [Gemmataceae bacterium]